MGQKQTLVCEHNVAGHVDKFSTPSMIGLIERASIEAIHVHMEEGQALVGFEVNLRHRAPAGIGETIIPRAELTEIYRNCLTFQVEAYDGETKLGRAKGPAT